MSGKDPPTLSQAQLEIMQIVWERGEVMVAEVWKILSERRRVARNTVQTLMVRLAEKGWLTCINEGHAFRYRSAVPQETTQRTMVQKLVDHAFAGSAEGLIHALVHGRGVSPDEAARIRRLIDEAESRTTEPGPKSGHGEEGGRA